MTMRRLSDILSDGSASIEVLLKEAFEAGKAEAAAEMRAKMTAVLDSVAGSADASRNTPSGVSPRLAVAIVADDIMSRVAAPERRAVPGTVKPEIIRLIRESGSEGVSTEDLISRTGFKPNSVRGTVSTLQLEHTIQKMGNRWVSADLIEAAAVESPGKPELN
jgi:hypothetical protein